MNNELTLSSSRRFAVANEEGNDDAVTLRTAEWRRSGLWRTHRVNPSHKALRQSPPYQGNSATSRVGNFLFCRPNVVMKIKNTTYINLQGRGQGVGGHVSQSSTEWIFNENWLCLDVGPALFSKVTLFSLSEVFYRPKICQNMDPDWKSSRFEGDD